MSGFNYTSSTTSGSHRNPRRIRRLVCGLSLAAVLLAVTLAGAGSAAALSLHTSGIYIGGNRSDFSSFSSWLGARPAHVADYAQNNSWATIEQMRGLATSWRGSGAQLVLSVPMLPAHGATLEKGAAGAYNSHFRTLAQNLVASGQTNTIIRLGWEMNGDWYPWSVKHGRGRTYIAYWRRIVTTMRAVDRKLKFDWCANGGSSFVNGRLLNPETAYPGNAYVDYIGYDLFDRSWIPNWRNQNARWQSFVSMPYGLRWHKRFAAAHHKAVTFPEWGLWQAGPNQGGDSPRFIRDMYDWMSHSKLAYQAYFDHFTSSLQFFPAAQATYRHLFGSRH